MTATQATRAARLVMVQAAAAVIVMALLVADRSNDGRDKPTGKAVPLVTVTYLTANGVRGRDAYVYTAIDKGYFREAGFAVEVKPGRGTEQNLALLEAGEADFAVVDITAALIAYGKGRFTDFRMVSAVHQRTLSCILALTTSGITTPEDLAGTTVAVDPGGLDKTLFAAYARRAGVDSTTIRWVAVPAQHIGPKLAAGSIDAAIQVAVARPGIEVAAKGRETLVLPFSKYLNDLYGDGLAVSNTIRTIDPEQVRRFNAALLRGLADAAADLGETGQIYAKHQPKGQPEPVAAAENALMAAYVSAPDTPVGAMDPARVARTVTLLQDTGAIPAAINPDNVIDIGFAPTK